MQPLSELTSQERIALYFGVRRALSHRVVRVHPQPDCLELHVEVPVAGVRGMIPVETSPLSQRVQPGDYLSETMDGYVFWTPAKNRGRPLEEMAPGEDYEIRLPQTRPMEVIWDAELELIADGNAP